MLPGVEKQCSGLGRHWVVLEGAESGDGAWEAPLPLQPPSVPRQALSLGPGPLSPGSEALLGSGLGRAGLQASWGLGSTLGLP